jgi:hypothetical protein
MALHMLLEQQEGIQRHCKEVLVLEDADESDLAVVNHAVIGKVLAPNSL